MSSGGAAAARTCGWPRPAIPGLTPLFASGVMRLSRWRCPAHRERMRRTPERAHAWPTFVFLHEGATFVHSPRNPGLLDCTRVGFHDAGAPFQSTHPQGGGDRGSELEVRPDLLGELLPRRAERGEEPFPTGSGPCPPEVFLVLAVLVRRLARSLATGEPPEPLEVEELGLRVASSLASPARLEARRRHACPTRAEKSRVEMLSGVLAASPGSRHTLDALARETGASAFQLCRAFHRVTGTTIHRHLTAVRLAQAIDRLADGCRDLTGLAFDLGFSSHSHFTLVFRKRLGMTPETARALAARGDLGALRRRVASPGA